MWVSFLWKFLAIVLGVGDAERRDVVLYHAEAGVALCGVVWLNSTLVMTFVNRGTCPLSSNSGTVYVRLCENGLDLLFGCWFFWLAAFGGWVD